MVLDEVDQLKVGEGRHAALQVRVGHGGKLSFAERAAEAGDL
jgi:hypothetical protein